ncbi:LUD domain-containing protein, partial [Arthrospira platensis SPKY1]|nr:LUD domain-containing protein [Arthrospira platensis SPKY1]
MSWWKRAWATRAGSGGCRPGPGGTARRAASACSARRPPRSAGASNPRRCRARWAAGHGSAPHRASPRAHSAACGRNGRRRSAMSSREQILKRLRQRAAAGAGQRPFPDAAPPQVYLPVVPRGDLDPTALRARFVAEARQAGCVLHPAETPEAAIAIILELVGGDTAVSGWDPAQIPLPGLAAALDAARISRATVDAGVRVGLTGVDAALAATGSIVVVSGDGRCRAASLLPPVHIAVVAAGQLAPDLE